MQEEINQRKQWENAYSGVEDFFGKEPSDLAIRVLTTLREKEAQMVLELGCGQGRDTWYLAENGIMVTALDYSESAIFQMRMVAKRECQEGMVTALVHDAREPLPFPDASFDAVYSHMFFTMEFSEEEVSRILDECRRVLKSGGINIFSVRNERDPHYDDYVSRGKDMWKDSMGFVVRFFTEEDIRQLSEGYKILWIREFQEGSLPFVKKLYEVVLQKPM